MTIFTRGRSATIRYYRVVRSCWRITLTVAIVVAVAAVGGALALRHGSAVFATPLRATAVSLMSASPPASPSPSPSPSFDNSAALPYVARIPSFPSPPVPEPVTLPPGNDALWLSRIPTTQPVAFITIDDGWTKLPVAAPLLRVSKVPVTLFLSGDAIQNDPEYFRPLQQAGAEVEAHSLNHLNLRGRGYGTQRHEICGSADQLAGWYGRRPVLFRPPYGEMDQTTLRVVRECGMKAAFHWSETVDKGVVRYQVGQKVQAGDILLMHFRPAFAEDFVAALQAIHAAGLTPALLSDYIAGA